MVLGLLWCNVGFAGSLVNTKWEITPIPMTSMLMPYKITFLHDDQCIYEDRKKSVVTCVWKNFGNELYYTINDFSYTEAIISGKNLRGKGYNNKDSKWKVIGKRID